jgi:hypothetical protein
MYVLQSCNVFMYSSYMRWNGSQGMLIAVACTRVPTSGIRSVIAVVGLSSGGIEGMRERDASIRLGG